MAAEEPETVIPVNPDEEAVQIVSIDEDANTFTLHEPELLGVLRKVPPSMKVGVVSVVGSFRTGKSFLLSFMLRYLRSFDEGATGERKPLFRGPRQARGASEWMRASDLLWGSANTDDTTRKASLGAAASAEAASPAAAASSADPAAGSGAAADDASARDDPQHSTQTSDKAFAFRHGAERTTTGIWMWNRPFFLSPPSMRGERIAVVLVDTQGMFDRRTGVDLTSAIFGLSTLLSSHLVYNISKNVSEDKLQTLALFSEYGRSAEAAEDRQTRASAMDEADGLGAPAAARPVSEARPPFQSVVMLVRDCDEVEFDAETFNGVALDHSNKKLMDDILAEDNTADIARTRDAIRTCYERIGVCRVPHPGTKVTRSKFKGEVSDVDAEFLCVVEKFVDDTFRRDLRPKTIRHVAVTAAETLRFMRAYAHLFKDATTFPKPQNILDATADANNRNAITQAFMRYDADLREVLDEAGNDVVGADELLSHNAEARAAAMTVFNSLATFGPDSSISAARTVLSGQIDERWTMYKEINSGRDPCRNIAIYGIPVAVAFVAVLVSFFTDMTCSPFLGVCRNFSDLLRFVAGIAALALVVVFLVRGRSSMKQMRRLLAYLAKARSFLGKAEARFADAEPRTPRSAAGTMPAASRSASNVLAADFPADSVPDAGVTLRRRRSRME
ncbi:hypothetical protein FNF27_01805 [Cafeteria roenbergensis]|uniref:GB1/RHD3-type G domain-containing protein n=1 Tax=Cafeteria roenbergensis TaxID=33653 RepID=A0A5A8EGY5_CAFRO|nr:hypothetical protein FNF27_01805 [Cafeteria roenbergensis]